MDGNDHGPHRDAKIDKHCLGKLQARFDGFGHGVGHPQRIKRLCMGGVAGAGDDAKCRMAITDKSNQRVEAVRGIDGQHNGACAIETEFVERFQESWSLYREESLQATLKNHSATATSSGQKALTAPASTPPPKLMDGWEAKQAEAGEDTFPPSPPKEGEEERPSTEGKPKGTPKRRAGPKADGEATAAKSHAAHLRQAVKAKNKIQAATAKYMDTESQINSDVAWEWARSSARRAEAQALSERLRSSASTFARAFMLEDKVAALLKRTPPAEVESELPKLIAAGVVAVELERVLSQLHRAHVQMHN